jgi:hypothetical protein
MKIVWSEQRRIQNDWRESLLSKKYEFFFIALRQSGTCKWKSPSQSDLTKRGCQDQKSRKYLLVSLIQKGLFNENLLHLVWQSTTDFISDFLEVHGSAFVVWGQNCSPGKRTLHHDSPPHIQRCASRSFRQINQSRSGKPRLLTGSLSVSFFLFLTMNRYHKGSYCDAEGYASHCKKKNSVVWVLERTIPTERPSLVGEVITNFCG